MATSLLFFWQVGVGSPKNYAIIYCNVTLVLDHELSLSKSYIIIQGHSGVPWCTPNITKHEH